MGGCSTGGEWLALGLLEPDFDPALCRPALGFEAGYLRLGNCNTGEVGLLSPRSDMPLSGPRTGDVDGVYSNAFAWPSPLPRP